MSEDEAHPPAAVGSIQPHTQQVLVEQVQLLYSNALTANIAVIAAAIFCTVILWSYIAPLPLLIWSVTLMAAALIRLSIIHSCHPQLQPSTAETLAKYYIGSTLLVSMAWSGFSLFLYQSDSPFVFSFVYIITFIVITASIPVLSVVQGAFFSYNLPPAITLTAVLLVNEAPHSQLFAAGVIIYFTLIAITGMNLNQRIAKSLKLEINNKELITHLIDEVERRVETQYDLEASKAVAEQANQSKSEFLANMSHEIRTPLHAIIGISELALLDEQSPEQKEYSRIINHTGLHLLRIVDGILDLSKIEAGKLEIEQKDFNMEEVLNNLTTIVSGKIKEKGLRFNLEIDPSLESSTLRGDPLRLSQVLINLTNNAIKFTKQGSITIRGQLKEESDTSLLVHFEVQDSGIGISDAQQQELFHAFKQADASTSRQYGGTGLGLTICKQLVELMGGEISLHSEVDKGSIFWFIIRFERGSSFSLPANNTVTDFHALAGMHILLVDDNLLNQKIAQRYLENMGVIIELANDGTQAIQQIKSNHYDLVLMDIQMPKMSGMEATRIIRNIPGKSRLPIIAMTANAMEQERKNCLAAGMNDFISKPFKLKHLYATLARWGAVNEPHIKPVDA